PGSPPARVRFRSGRPGGFARPRPIRTGMATRYLEDFPAGSSAELGSIHVTEDEIRAFATRYDPQPFHTDPEMAKRWPYGGLIASGWHTASMMMRVVVDHFVDGETSLGPPGLGPIRWKPRVRPGAVLRVRARVADAHPLAQQARPRHDHVRGRGAQSERRGRDGRRRL